MTVTDPATGVVAAWGPSEVPTTALLTDHYELTMVRAALRGGTANRRCVFELFARRLPEGRRYGVVAGVGRALRALRHFRFDEESLRLETQCFARRGEVRMLFLRELSRPATGCLRDRGSRCERY